MYSKRGEALQAEFRFEGDDRVGYVCNCFHGVLDGVTRASGELMCSDAPWWCPRVAGATIEGNPRTSNTGVRHENLTQAEQG